MKRICSALFLLLVMGIGPLRAGDFVVTPDGSATLDWLNHFIVSSDQEVFFEERNYTGELPYLVTPSGKKVTVTGYKMTSVEKIVHLFPHELCLETGEYKLVLPEGYIWKYTPSYEHEYMPTREITYTKGEATPATFTSVPEKGSTVKKFQNISITFPGVTTIKQNSTYRVYMYRDGEDAEVFSASMEYGFKINGNTLNYSYYQEVVDGGHYRMMIPEGFVLLDGEPNAPFQLEFDIAEGEALKMVVSPAEDSETTGIVKSCLVSFPEDSNVKVSTSSSITMNEIHGDIEWFVGYASSSQISRRNATTFKVDFNGFPTNTGDCKISFPKNMFSKDDKHSPDTSVVFHFTAPEAPLMVVTPEGGSVQEELQKFTVSFPSESNVTLNTMRQNVYLCLYKGEIEKNEYGMVMNQVVANCNSQTLTKKDGVFSFSLMPLIKEEGTYSLVIPAGLFLVGTQSYNHEAILTYTIGEEVVTGVRAVGLSSADAVVYDLQGRRISAPTKPGIYIKNGRKFVYSKK